MSGVEFPDLLPGMYPEQALEIALAAGEAEVIVRRVAAANSEARKRRWEEREVGGSFYFGVVAACAPVTDALDPRCNVEDHPSMQALVHRPPIRTLEDLLANGPAASDPYMGTDDASEGAGGDSAAGVGMSVVKRSSDIGPQSDEWVQAQRENAEFISEWARETRPVIDRLLDEAMDRMRDDEERQTGVER